LIASKRNTLEIIFDTCSSGNDILDTLQKLTQYSIDNHHFDDVKFISPLQIGTEIKQRLFADFLQKELARNKDKKLHKFYRENAERFEFIETPVSISYKYFFAKKTLKLAYNDFYLRSLIIQNTLEFINSFYPELKNTFTRDKLEKTFRLYAQSIDRSYEDCKRNYDRSAIRVQKVLSRLGVPQDVIDIVKTEAKDKILYRHAKKFLATAPEEFRFVLQNIYSNEHVRNYLKHDPEFKKFRADKGEMAIVGYLERYRLKPNDRVVTLIVSEDNGARKNIQNLRRKTQNPIFVLSSYGLGIAMKKIGLIDNLEDVVKGDKFDAIEKRHKRSLNKISSGFRLDDDDILVPTIEEKWANRLVDILQTGYWS
jgi:hypothetical protein